MTSAICTLFEGHYHYGVGALANSLYAHGFRGTIYAGYRGSLPPWVTGPKEISGFTEFNPAEGLILRFIPLTTKLHLTNFKPDFMLDIWEKHCPQAKALFYFDPDITTLCRWTFFEEWVEAGVAVCQDVNGSMPGNHPIRHAWRKLLQPRGLEFHHQFETYFNCGFIGLCAGDRTFLNDWQHVQSLMQKCGADFQSLGVGDRTFPFTCRDQDALNITCMVTGRTTSPMGQDGMDFQHRGGGYVMSHAAGGTKPWRKRMLMNAIVKGDPPSRADKSFYDFARRPIQLFSSTVFLLKRMDLKLASALGRYLG